MKHPVRYAKTLVAALVLALSAVFLVQAPAQAGGGTFTYCFWVQDDKGVWQQVCPTIEVPVAGPRYWWPPECWVCLPLFRFEDHAVNPADRADFYGQLGQGQVLLAQAGLTKDEKLADRLRAEAADAFYAAAKLIGKGGEVTFKEFAWIDPESGKLYGSPLPEPPTIAAKAMAEGLRYMQQAALDPQPVPWIEAAMKEFEHANTVLTEFAAT
ncbi:hypothetical protein [Glycomyces terrestris]|uniref:Uncharacterized protein n=1 Tax=Glycomyces terrestris TaxID=2493553 RepID=A0A426V4I3_9ACTN|nr:hypothetical protein [Glycomyces terrestris]RRS01787.1 hypothetical protein EIW28_03245 [Glycomyces terrestris]